MPTHTDVPEPADTPPGLLLLLLTMRIACSIPYFLRFPDVLSPGFLLPSVLQKRPLLLSRWLLGHPARRAVVCGGSSGPLCASVLICRPLASWTHAWAFPGRSCTRPAPQLRQPRMERGASKQAPACRPGLFHCPLPWLFDTGPVGPLWWCGREEELEKGQEDQWAAAAA